MRFNQTRLSLVPVKGKVSDSRGGVLPGVSILAKGSQRERPPTRMGIIRLRPEKVPLLLLSVAYLGQYHYGKRAGEDQSEQGLCGSR